MPERFTLQCSSLPDDTRLVFFRGVEALSAPYEYEIFFVVPHPADFDMADVIGAKGTLTGDLGDGSPPLVRHGLFSSIKLLEAHTDGAVFRAVMGPRLAQLGMTHRCRLFTKQTIVDILKEVLAVSGFTRGDYELRLNGHYEQEEHVCQYQESDLAFLQRWMELEGMYYFFEHGGDEEKLIITDNKASHDKLVDEAVRYRPTASHDGSAGASFHAFSCQHQALPASVTLRDYDYAKPSLEVIGTAPVSATGFGDMNYHAGRFFTRERGKHLANLRAEELRAGEVIFLGAGTVMHLAAGHHFTLDEHPLHSMNTTYLATRVHHVGNLAASTEELQRLIGMETEGTYRSTVEAIKSTVQYRPRRLTPWPRIYSFETGMIDGAADSEYAQIDDQGRYLVKFKFDESDLKDGKASTWVRMMQPHGGGVEGWHFPLRKGTEVVISFFGGDPDRPVISGVVPNAHTPSPVTATNHTANIIQTGGRNRIELEDREGSQRFTMFSPTESTMIRFGAPNDRFNLKLFTKGHYRMDIGKESEDLRQGEVTEIFEKAWVHRVVGPVQQYYQESQTTNVTGDTIVSITQGDYAVKTDQKMALKADVARGDEVTGVWKRTILSGQRDDVLHGTDTSRVDETALHTIGKGYTLTVEAGSIDLDASTGINMISGQNVTVQALTGNFNVSCLDSDVTTLGDNKNTSWGAAYSVTGGNALTIYLGFKEEMSITGSLSLSAGVSTAMSTGLKVDLFAGPSFSTKSIDMQFCSINVANIQTKLSTTKLSVKNCFLHMIV